MSHFIKAKRYVKCYEGLGQIDVALLQYFPLIFQGISASIQVIKQTKAILERHPETTYPKGLETGKSTLQLLENYSKEEKMYEYQLQATIFNLEVILDTFSEPFQLTEKEQAEKLTLYQSQYDWALKQIL